VWRISKFSRLGSLLDYHKRIQLTIVTAFWCDELTVWRVNQIPMQLPLGRRMMTWAYIRYARPDHPVCFLTTQLSRFRLCCLFPFLISGDATITSRPHPVYNSAVIARFPGLRKARHYTVWKYRIHAFVFGSRGSSNGSFMRHGTLMYSRIIIVCVWGL